MTFEFPKEWCVRMAHLEGNSEIGAGLAAIDPVFDTAPVVAASTEEMNIAFSRFVRLGRRERGLTVEKLAEDAAVEVSELVSIEENNQHKPDLRTVYQLANYFRVDNAYLLQVAGLTAPRDGGIREASVRFAARSEPVSALTPEEREAYYAFVAVLSKRK